MIYCKKRIIRIISYKEKWVHTLPLFENLKIVGFNELITLRIVTLMYKGSRGMLPHNVQTKLNFNKNVKPYNLRNKDKYVAKYVRTKLKSKCISCYGVKLFNDLPNSISSAESVSMFKNKMKKYILEGYSS